ncbi:hypothetical protein [Thiolapillus sp.]|nr:hypothetical protein [Thiolapillus sp.]
MSHGVLWEILARKVVIRCSLNCMTKCVFGLVIDFGTSQSPKSTRPLTT